MARKKKETRETSFVTIRTKDRAKGRKVIYLDCYRNGKRSYEFLKLYLVPEVDEATKQLNQNTMEQAKAIRNLRENEIIHDGELQPQIKSKLLLTDWLNTFSEKKKKAGEKTSRSVQILTVRKQLIDFKGEKTKLSDVDEDFCKGYINYLATKAVTNSKSNPKHIMASTAMNYFKIFISALNYAVKKKLIKFNPTRNLDEDDLKPIKPQESLRTYLTIDEVRKLMATECENDLIKRAFLFGCFTGLRISDIRKLKWSDLKTRNGKTYMSIIIKKTLFPLGMKLSKEALRWLPKKGEDNGVIFKNLPQGSWISYILKDWAKDAGLENPRSLCFHVSRHTFATMELTLGADCLILK